MTIDARDSNTYDVFIKKLSSDSPVCSITYDEDRVYSVEILIPLAAGDLKRAITKTYALRCQSLL